MSFDKQRDSRVKLKVIGAGLMRTGTSSLKVALEHLLAEPYYHMSRVAIEDREPSIQKWLAAFANDGEGLEDALNGFGATVDYPACCFYQKLLEAYPEVSSVCEFHAKYICIE